VFSNERKNIKKDYSTVTKRRQLLVAALKKQISLADKIKTTNRFQIMRFTAEH